MKSLPLAALVLLVSGCSFLRPAPERAEPMPLKSVPLAGADGVQLLNRLTWGANASSARELAQLGPERWLDRQLRPPLADGLPPEAQAQVAAMTIVKRPMLEIARELAEQRRAFLAETDAEKRAAGQRAWQEELRRLAREAMTRSMLRALHSPWQLREQATWFWMNHFSVFVGKPPLAAFVGDYEENAVRPRALGRFRDLLGAVARHPAMLRYLDNAQNAAGRLNENYARELMELHTLGVDGGYTQKDVQELARVLTGHGIFQRENFGRIRPDLVMEYRRDGLFEFHPARHDYGAKALLGEPIRVRGAAELDEALDRLARHPSTARHVSRKLAVFFVADDPPAALVERMAAAWRASDGDIAEVLRAMLRGEEFAQSLGKKFKDPYRYVVSALRLAYDGAPLPNAAVPLGWLARMGQPLYGRQTPDGYPLTRSEWASAGQLAARFEVARQIGYGLNAPLAFEPMQASLGPATRQALEKAGSPQERNLLLLSSPEFMSR